MLFKTGTGKDLRARHLHDNSIRSSGTFEAITCGTIPETIIGSELFGFERGWPSPARKTRYDKMKKTGLESKQYKP
ncbi:sigma 54-interacting transcriptional regulator [Zhongshania sp. BJYM1]|uniref:sigma 54-interacting transcriptional regulator n=1 Tax=Zhongshania aquatica TaxID=2965069 RepID=UPI0022B39707|nr:sigma 54-interacting transcriptional regulator [Marortus sp. BJYM1]